MPDNAPLLAVGPRGSRVRPRPVPRAVRGAISLMVVGRLDDADCAPLDLVEAARAVGLRPPTLRRYFDRPEVRALLLAERRAFRTAICAGNEAALQRVRDKSRNGMVTVAAVRALKQLDTEEADRAPAAQSPGITIRVVNAAPAGLPPRTIDVTPVEPAREPIPDARSRPLVPR